MLADPRVLLHDQSPASQWTPGIPEPRLLGLVFGGTSQMTPCGDSCTMPNQHMIGRSSTGDVVAGPTARPDTFRNGRSCMEPSSSLKPYTSLPPLSMPNVNDR